MPQPGLIDSQLKFKKMEEAKIIANALAGGTLKVGSKATGTTLPVLPLQNLPIISEHWHFEKSFDDLCKSCLYCFRIHNKSREDNKPHFAMAENGARIEFVQISNDNSGITVSGVGAMQKSKLDNADLEISKDGNQMVVEYLIETGASELIV